MTYLILGQDGSIGGYDRADILLCDLATNETPQAIWRRTDSLQTRFAPSSVDEVRADLESTKYPEFKGINGHASPFCGALDLTESLEAA